MTFQRVGAIVLAIVLLLLGTACASQSGLEETQAQLATLQQQVDDLSKALDQANAQATTQKASLDQAQADVDALESNVGTLEKDAATSKDLAKTADQLDALENTFAFYKDDVDTLKAAQYTLAKKTDLNSFTTADSKLSMAAKLSRVADAYFLLDSAQTLNQLAESFSAIETSVGDTGDGELATAWDNVQAAFDNYVTVQTDPALSALNDYEYLFVNILRQKQADALK